MLGFWFAITSHFIYMEPLFKLCQNLIENRETALVRITWIASALLVAALTVQIINYEVVMEFDNPASWSIMMDEKCGEGASDDAYQTRSLSDFG